MKRSLKITLLISLTIITLIIGILCVKNNKLDEKEVVKEDYINISELSPKFMADYFEDYNKLKEKDNKENILIITSKTRPQNTYGATDIVEAPNHQYILQYNDEEEKNHALDKFQQNENVIAEENLTRQITNTVTETFNSWGIEKMGLNYASNFVNSNGGEDVTVAIIDSGLDVTLFNQEFPNKLAGTYNAYDKGEMRDTNGHGTHIAGTIAEGTPNNVKIYAYKVGAGREFYISDIIESIYHIIDEKTADVINMSFGSYSISDTETIAIRSAMIDNIICVAAAGNENVDQEHYPAALDTTISVSSVDINLNKSDFSNYHSSVDFAAPGTSIMSISSDPSKVIKSGTSMATPHVVSAVAILKTFNKNLTLEDTINALKMKAQDLGTPGKDDYFGYGFINFENTNFCNGTDCDMWNIYEKSSITKIVSPNTVKPKYNYGSNMNIYNAEIHFYYTETEYFVKKLIELENAEIKNYDPNSKTMQNVTVSFEGNDINIQVDNTSIINGWIYEEIDENSIQINAFYVDESNPLINVIIPSTINSKEVISIGESAFWGNDSIISVELPDTITTIKEYAFYDCRFLKEINFPEGLTTIGDRAFESNSIRNLELPSSITTIGYAAFTGNKYEELVIPEALTDIGVSAFSENYQLESIVVDPNNPAYDSRNNCNAIIETDTNILLTGTKNTIIPNDIVELADDSFSQTRMESITIPETVTSIGKFAFYGSEITSIELPQNITTISQGTFYNSGLVSIEIPENVKEIADMAFEYCYDLENVTFNEKLEKIDDYAFNETALKNIHIPKNVKEIGYQSFYNLHYIESLTIDSENETYDSRDNSHAIIETSTNTLIAGFEPTRIPSSVTKIADESFSGTITEINIPEGVTTIGNYAFSDLEPYSIEKITLPKSVSSLGWETFAYREYGYDKTEGIYKYKYYYYPNLTIWVYDNTYSKNYIVSEKYSYLTRDPYKIDVNITKRDYEVYDTVDTTNLSLKLYYADAIERTETITEGYTIEYINGDSFRATDRYFTISGTNNIGETYSTKVEVTISKKTPLYTIPTNLTAMTSQKLGDIALPIGFSWMDEDEIITTEGVHKFKAKFTPDDTDVYKVVENIEIPITVRVGKYVVTPEIDIANKTYDGTATILEESISIKNLISSEYTISNISSDSINAGKANVTFTLTLSDDKFENYSLENGEQSNTYTKEITIEPIMVAKPTLVEKVYTYTGEEQTAEIIGFDDSIMNITNNKQTNAGQYNIVISFISDNYAWIDNNSSKTVVLKFIINKLPINVNYSSSDKTVVYDGEEYTIDLTYDDLPDGVKLRFADEFGQYTLTTIPKYTEPGIYVIKFKFFISNNYEEIADENTLKIKSSPIENNTKDYEAIYDGKLHSLKMEIDADDYEVRYSINNTNYNLSGNPTFKDVGEYTVNYKITCATCDTVYGSNKVKIYGIKSFDSSLTLKNNYLLVKNYNNSFTNISNRISIIAKTKQFKHYNESNAQLYSDTTKSGDKIKITINGVKDYEYILSILGDVNSDGKITSADYIKIRKHIMKTELITSSFRFYAADMTEDNKITSADYIRIRKRIMEGR